LEASKRLDAEQAAQRGLRLPFKARLLRARHRESTARNLSERPRAERKRAVFFAETAAAAAFATASEPICALQGVVSRFLPVERAVGQPKARPNGRAFLRYFRRAGYAHPFVPLRLATAAAPAGSKRGQGS